MFDIVKQKRRIISHFLMEYVLSMSAYWVCAGVLVAKLTEYFKLPLGLSNFLTGLSSSLLLLQLLGGGLYPCVRKKRRYLIITNIAWRIMLCLVFLCVLLPQESGGVAVCGLLILMQVVYQICAPAQADWQVKAVEELADATYYTHRETYFMFLYTVMIAITEAIVAILEPRNMLQESFCIIGLIEIALLGTSCVFLFHLPSPTQEAKSISLFSFGRALTDRRFAPVLWTNAFWGFANIFVGGFATLYAVRILQVNFTQIMIWTTVGNFLRAVFTPVFASLASKIGWKHCLLLQIVLTLIVAIGWWLCDRHNSFWLVPLLFSSMPVPIAGITLGLFRLQVETSPKAQRSVYFSLNAAVSGALALLGTALCSALVTLVESGILERPLSSVFILGGMLLCIPVFFLYRIQDNIY